MAFAIIASVEETGSSTTVDTTGADLIAISSNAFGGANGTPSDSKGNTWTALTNRAGGGFHERIFYCFNPIVGSGHFFTPGTNAYALTVLAVSGGDSYESESGAGNSNQPGSLTPSENGALLVSGLTYGLGGPTTIDSGFTIAEEANNNYGLAYLIQGTAAAVNPAWNAASGDHACAMAAFLPAAGGGAVVVPVDLAHQAGHQAQMAM